jgi:mannosyltransferase
VNPNARASRSVWLAAASVGGLAALLGSITLGRKSLWFDEAFNAVLVTESWHGVADRIWRTEMSQSLYLVLLKLWALVTPNTEVWLRLPSLLVMALAAALVVPLGARLFDPMTGLLAGILMALNQFVVAWSQQARAYALVTLAVVVASLLLLRALNRGERINWALYAVAAAAAVYCHFYAGLVVVAHFVSMPFAPRRPTVRRMVETAVAIALMSSIALIFTATASRSQIGWLPAPLPALFDWILPAMSGHNVLFLLTAATGVAVLARRATRGDAADRFDAVLVTGWVTIPILLGLLVSIVQPMLMDRYLIVVTPGLALAAAVALVKLGRATRPVAVVVLTALVAISLVKIVDWYRSQIEDWRGAAAYVERERRPGDRVVVAPQWADLVFKYYAPSTPLTHSVDGRKTFLVLRPESGSCDETASTVAGLATATIVADRRFGDNLCVRLVEPRS